MPKKKKKNVSIKETEELLAMLKLLAKKGHDIWEDKQVNMDDFVHVIDLAKNSDVIADGIKDVNEIEAELKDLDRDELVKIVVELYGIAKVLV